MPLYNKFLKSMDAFKIARNYIQFEQYELFIYMYFITHNKINDDTIYDRRV